VDSSLPNPGCFLCSPDNDLVYLDDGEFFAMLGHGPIGEGYSIIATVEHEPSMLDLTPAGVARGEAFATAVRNLLEPLYGPAVVTEHGRVAPCVDATTRAHEPHCLHAHRLVFPGLVELPLVPLRRSEPWRDYPSFESLRVANDRPLGQYLSYQPPAGGVRVTDVVGPLQRQYFRAVAATVRRQPELADWRRVRGDATIDAARRALGGT
jgi:hypothetical protein